MMFLQRAVLIFVIFLGCFWSCLSTNCANFPFHPSCRGTMKRTFRELGFSNFYPHYRRMYDNSRNGCSPNDCKGQIKYLFTLLKNNANLQPQDSNEQNLYNDYEAVRRLISEQRSNNNLFGMKDMNQDYID
ncbi:uncharacterized protein LOC116843617 [Odontomachus brunneus]|uniref:uncharacterized protein LOC116843617 n=1 Tax=Odontomachus brunneus TaxID=486640 RepID=UPI0013F24199|nr:uncharacterized protein LOC116843617 [Odontomachus brunneus]